jgi:hypothetical protein
MKRLRGLRALIEEAVEHGSRAVERIHTETAQRPFVILESIPVIAGAARVVHVLHDFSVSTTYGTIRLVNRGVGQTLDMALAALEARDATPHENDRKDGDAR